MSNQIVLRKIEAADCQIISDAFKAQGSNDKTVELYKRYLSHQSKNERDIIIAMVNNEFAGYLTISWNPEYKPFSDKNIPEISDFNVLKKFQRLGIGSKLMDEAELRISKTSTHAGIGFGVFADYGPAQILYINRGYIPLGTGIVRNGESLQFGDEVIIDHSLAFYLTKTLR